MCVCLLVIVFHFCLSPRDKQFVCLHRTTIFTHRRGIHFYMEMLVIMMLLMVLYDVVSRAKTLESRVSKLFAGARIDRGRALKVQLNKKLFFFFCENILFLQILQKPFCTLFQLDFGESFCGFMTPECNTCFGQEWLLFNIYFVIMVIQVVLREGVKNILRGGSLDFRGVLTIFPISRGEQTIFSIFRCGGGGHTALPWVQFRQINFFDF